jgi:hypothetical protein
MVHSSEMVSGHYLEWVVPLNESSLASRSKEPNVADPEHFWNSNFYGAQTLFLLHQGKVNVRR